MKSNAFKRIFSGHPNTKSRIGEGLSPSFLPMKTKLLILFMLCSIITFGQFDVNLMAGAGQSQHFSFDHKHQEMLGFSLNPVVTFKMGALVEWSKYSFIQPYTGVQFTMLGSMDKNEENAPVNPNTTYSFKHHYITIPLGFSIPVYKAFGVDLALLNSFQLSDRASEIIAAESNIWDFALQPGVYAKIGKWKGGVTYYVGLTDVFGVGELDETDLRFFNRAWHINISYNLFSLGK